MPVEVWVALIGVLGATAAGVVPQVISRDRTRRVLDEIELLDQVVEHFGVESDQAKVLTESISSRVDSYSRPAQGSRLLSSAGTAYALSLVALGAASLIGAPDPWSLLRQWLYWVLLSSGLGAAVLAIVLLAVSLVQWVRSQVGSFRQWRSRRLQRTEEEPSS